MECQLGPPSQILKESIENKINISDYNRHIWNKIKTNLIRQLRIYITDALNRPVNLNGIPVHLTLLLREDTNNIQ